MPTRAHLAPAQISVILLAAGHGRRFLAGGGQVHKLQARLAGKTVLEHALSQVQASGLPYQLVQPCGDDRLGMGDSIARGVAASQQAAGWLILPADLPLVQPATLRAVAQELLDGDGHQAVVPHWQGQPGHPVGFARPCLPALLALRGEIGAKSVLQALRQQGRVLSLALDDPGMLMDIDTPEDLAQAERWLNQRPD